MSLWGHCTTLSALFKERTGHVSVVSGGVIRTIPGYFVGKMSENHFSEMYDWKLVSILTKYTNIILIYV